MDSINAFIPGEPIPQGSMQAITPPGHTRSVIVSDNPRLKAWRHTVALHLRQATSPPAPAWPTGPVALELELIMPRRKAEPVRTTRPHTRRPDLDKLVRAVMDAATGILYRDDAQVTGIAAWKRTARPAELPGLQLRAWQE